MHCVECPSGSEQIEAGCGPFGRRRSQAGGSARREHERRVAKRETETRGKWGDRLGGAILKLTTDPQATRAWRIGAEGEEKLATALAEVEAITVLNDRRVKGTRGNIDHIVIAPAGVFVVDAKNYRGLIRVRDRGGWLRTDLRLYVGSRDCWRLAEGLRWQVEAVSRALASADVDDLPAVTPVLCFVDGELALVPAPSYLRTASALKGSGPFGSLCCNDTWTLSPSIASLRSSPLRCRPSRPPTPAQRDGVEVPTVWVLGNRRERDATLPI